MPEQTYTVRATFEAKDGTGRRHTRIIGQGLPLIEALDKKTTVVERVPWCIEATMTPEVRRGR